MPPVEAARTVAERAPAKVNLFLHVTGRRADGYHILDSLMVFVDVVDTVTAALADGFSLSINGPQAAKLISDPDNLVLRAARALRAAAGVTRGAHLTLTKDLPVAAGIGGGSADAAAALRALQRLWGIAVPPALLRTLAADLGADVPVCLEPIPQRLRGIGAEITPFSHTMPKLYAVLVNAGMSCATPAVFKARQGPFGAAAGMPEEDVLAWIVRNRNDLTAPASTLVPGLGTVLAALAAQPGCLLARMSGSGATCFGIFAEETGAAAAQMALAAAYPAWWVASGKVLGASG